MDRRGYTCAVCGGTFAGAWSDVDAIKEYEKVFSEEMQAYGDQPPALVCDSCYQRMIVECPPEQAWAEYQKNQK